MEPESHLPISSSWEAAKPIRDDRLELGSGSKTGRYPTLARAMAVLGPGVMVCLADSDIGGLFTMAVAGSKCGYALLPLQLLLVPPLFMAQELTIRIGVSTRRSLCGLAYDHFGNAVGSALLMACLGVCGAAVVSEFTGVAAVGELWGVPRWISCSASAALLSTLILSGSFKSIERVGLALGMCLSVFVVVGTACYPGWQEMKDGARQSSEMLQQPAVRELVAANIGTVVTPWMLFYQLSATVEKRLTVTDVPVARVDTAVGALATQVVMASVLVTYAKLAYGTSLENLPLDQALIAPLSSTFGVHMAKVLMSAGLFGSSLLATLVAALGAAWNVSDVLGGDSDGSEMSLPQGALWRFGVLASVMTGAILVGSGMCNIITLNIFIQVVNGMAMPITVGVLFVLARMEDVVHPALRLKGWYCWCVGIVLTICSIVAVGCTTF